MANISKFKTSLLTTFMLLTGACTQTTSGSLSEIDNHLSAVEKAEGWRLLFDGKSLDQWRNFKQNDIAQQWQVVNGELQLVRQGGGDLISQQQYKNFELKLDWRISEGGNSGIFIMADEKGDYIFSHAVEVQILDNERHPDNKIDSHLSGSIYDLIPAPVASHKPAGQWNHVHIKLLERHLQVWQNQIKTADIVIGSDTWNGKVAKSKFATWPGFGESFVGHIGLQDHGDQVSFKNIKVKEIK